VRKKLFGNGLRTDLSVVSIREGDSSKPKTLHNIDRFFDMLLENDSTERKHEKSSC